MRYIVHMISSPRDNASGGAAAVRAVLSWAALALVLAGCGARPRVAPMGPCADPASCCPRTLPAAHASCGPASLVCEYGDAARYACNTLAECAPNGTGAGAWVIHPPDSFAHCRPVGSPASCPASRLGDLRPWPNGTSCVLPDGNVCEYQRGPRPLVSGFRCIADEEGCMPRPRIGSACTDHRCTYESHDERCVNGRWTVDLHPPPPLLPP